MPVSKQSTRRRKGLSGSGGEPQTKSDYQYEKLEDYPKQPIFKPEVLKKMVDEGLHDSVEEAKRFILEVLNK